MMYRRTGLLIAGWSILMMVGCSTLEDTVPATVEKLDTQACETCHSLLPLTENHIVHIDTSAIDSNYKTLLPLECDDCHEGYDDRLGWRNESLHRDGVIDTIDGECAYCHDHLRDCGWCHSLPPSETEKQRKVHKHVTEQDFSCDICHKGYDTLNRVAPRETHDNGHVDVMFRTDTLQKKGMPTAPYFSGDSCYNLYCHGAVTLGGKQTVAINDTQQQGSEQCDFCHNTTQLYNEGFEHHRPGHQTLYLDCNNCHNKFSYRQQGVLDTAHFNGQIDTLKATCNSNSCHVPPLP